MSWSRCSGRPSRDIRLLRGWCARINHRFIPAAHLQCPPFCITVARFLDSIRVPFRLSAWVNPGMLQRATAAKVAYLQQVFLQLMCIDREDASSMVTAGAS